MVVAFRRQILLPLDDCLYAVQAPPPPQLTRSSLHRCLRHGISRLPEIEGERPAAKKFKVYPIGYFHIDIAEVRTEQGKLYLFVAMDRTSKFAFVPLHEKARTWVSSDFLKALIEVVPYQIHTVLTDNGVHFTTPGSRISGAAEIKLALQQGELEELSPLLRIGSREGLRYRRVEPLWHGTTPARSSCSATVLPWFSLQYTNAADGELAVSGFPSLPTEVGSGASLSTAS